MINNMYDNNYIPPILTVDSVIFQLINNQLHVLLIKRTAEPFAGNWALPGGYCAAGETTYQAMDRVLTTKAGLHADDLRHVEQLYTFDTVARDPRGHAVSVTYSGLGLDISPVSTEHTQAPQFFAIDALPELAYDHKDIIAYAHERLISKLDYTNICFALLPKLFTLTKLQSAYEAIIGRELDKRNFRKKFMSLNMIEETDEMLREGPHRPARLYQFSSTTLQRIHTSFEQS
jgi:8-oxo-dGTP diphosphatase